jgi:hypothetical protein
MTFLRSYLLACALAVTAALAGGQMVQADGAGGAILTVTGNLSQPNRGAYDENTDKFLGYHEVTFDKARAFSAADLAGLETVTVKADFPKGGDVHAFSGPTLAAVLAASGATGDTVTIQALDGYAVEAPLADMIAQGAVVATSRDGHPMGIGDFGPTQIVFPRADRDDLKDMPDDWWVWSIFHIRVE